MSSTSPESMEESPERKTRKRSMTELSLDWLAEKLRKTERIKEELSSGTYKVDSSSIAASIVNEEESD